VIRSGHKACFPSTANVRVRSPSGPCIITHCIENEILVSSPCRASPPLSLYRTSQSNRVFEEKCTSSRVASNFSPAQSLIPSAPLTRLSLKISVNDGLSSSRRRRSRCTDGILHKHTDKYSWSSLLQDILRERNTAKMYAFI
jgi:hypothetical protein